jgi:hypothetical protein
MRPRSQGRTLPRKRPFISQLIGVSHDDCRGTKIKEPARDTQYKMKRRNALDKLETRQAERGGNRPLVDPGINRGGYGRRHGRHAAAPVTGQPSSGLVRLSRPSPADGTSVITFSERDGCELAKLDLDYGRLPRPVCF